MSEHLPEAHVHTPTRYHLIWLVPLIAAALAVYLIWTTLAARGPLITITFPDGRGLTAGETKVEHKAVAIGTVEHVSLTEDDRRVIVAVRMAKNAARLLTTHARFWVVRPQFSLTDISDLQTLFSGSYIAIDPGAPGGASARQFEGLSSPPGVRSDEPGSMFTLESPRLGSLNVGGPVFYRDIVVGELIGYQELGMAKPIRMQVFVRSPYDRYVRSETHFWDASGIAMNFGPQGLRVVVESMQALLAGGVSFANFADADRSPAPGVAKVFKLYDSYDDAENAGFRDNVQYVTYFFQSAAGLQPGAAVRLYGIRIGTVTGMQLEPYPDEPPRVRVTFEVQPARIYPGRESPPGDPLRITKDLVALGMRARIETANLLTGQEVLGLDIVSGAPSAAVTMEGERIVWPSAKGGFQDLTDSLGVVMDKLKRLPLDRVGDQANDLLASLRKLARTANDALMPIGKKLPMLTRDLDDTLTGANRMLQSVQHGYGETSQINQQLQQLAVEATRSLHALTDYLGRHPSSVLWGR